MAGRDPVARMACWNVTCSRPRAVSTSNDSGVADRRPALDVLHLAQLGELARAAGELRDDLVLPATQLVELDARFAKMQAPRRGVLRFGQELCGMQQRFRRNASTVDAHAPWRGLGVDERHLHPEIGGKKCSGIAPGASAEHSKVSGVSGHRVEGYGLQAAGYRQCLSSKRCGCSLGTATRSGPQPAVHSPKPSACITPGAPSRTAARAHRRPSEGSGWHRHRR